MTYDKIAFMHQGFSLNNFELYIMYDQIVGFEKVDDGVKILFQFEHLPEVVLSNKAAGQLLSKFEPNGVIE